MADLFRVRVGWSGVIAGPGLTTFYTNATPVVAGFKALFTTEASAFPPGITWTIFGSGDIINDADGVLTGAWGAGGDLTEVSTGSSANVAPQAGAIIKWSSTTILDGHRVSGRTFLVPLVTSNYIGSVLATAFRNTLQTAATALVSSQASHLCLWHRPRVAKPATATSPAVSARPGGTAIITGATVPSKPATLNSRRD